MHLCLINIIEFVIDQSKMALLSRGIGFHHEKGMDMSETLDLDPSTSSSSNAKPTQDRVSILFCIYVIFI